MTAADLASYKVGDDIELRWLKSPELTFQVALTELVHLNYENKDSICGVARMGYDRSYRTPFSTAAGLFRLEDFTIIPP